MWPGIKQHARSHWRVCLLTKTVENLVSALEGSFDSQKLTLKNVGL